MLSKFWDKIIEGLAEGWNGGMLLPAGGFWGMGLAAWVGRFGLPALQNFLNSVDVTQAVLLAFGGLFLLTVSSWLAQQLVRSALRMAEGYWPGPLARLSRWLAQRLSRRLQGSKDRWQELAARYEKERSHMTAVEMEEYTDLDAGLVLGYPRKPNLFLPTRLGNLLRAAEEYPDVRYGLETRITWPRLWPLLPDNEQKELAQARAALDDGARLLVWGVFLVVWVIWAWWALAAAAVLLVAGYLSMLEAAGVYGELLRAAYDLHRFDLYKALHWKLPVSPAEEEKAGRALTQFLHRGVAPENFQYQ